MYCTNFFRLAKTINFDLVISLSEISYVQQIPLANKNSLYIMTYIFYIYVCHPWMKKISFDYDYTKW